jgi:hypothetical protein
MFAPVLVVCVTGHFTDGPPSGGLGGGVDDGGGVELEPLPAFREELVGF